MVDPLLAYFKPLSLYTDLIDGPHPGSSRVVSRVEQYYQGKQRFVYTLFLSKALSPVLRMVNNNATHILFKMRDFLSVLEWVLVSKKRYDLFIGLESVYTLAGILLKKIGMLKFVVYYVSDYSPDRYESRLFNNIYLLLDRFCCYHADYIWDVSPAMMPARIQAGLVEKRAAPCILVPNALFPEQMIHRTLESTRPFSLVFAGTLGPENGPEIALEAMPLIISKFPEAHLHIFGGNDEFEESLRALVKKLNIMEHVTSHGFISDQQKLSRAISAYRIGLAPYKAIPNSPRWYADATKLRLYLGAGLPVITTHVPPLGIEIMKKGAGIIVKDTAKDLTNAILSLFKNEKKYSVMRKAAVSFAKDNTWDTTYGNAMREMNTAREFSI